MTDRKDFSTSVFFTCAIVALLSHCSPVSSFFFLQPRVTRTHDAVIIDFKGVGYVPLHLGKNYGQIANQGGFNLVPQFNPNAEVQQHPKFSNPGWSYYVHPSVNTLAGVSSNWKFTEDGVRQAVKQVTSTTTTKPTTTTTKPTTTTAAPAIQCGRGPATFPTSRSLISERIVGDNAVDANKNSWPFVVYLSSYSVQGIPCAGSLISDTKVLMAAQCFETMPLIFASLATVSIGAQSIGDPPNALASAIKAQMTRRITNVVLHSKYNALTFANDIAIVTLDSPVPFSRTVAPVCLPPASTDPDQYADQNAIIMGWGVKGSSTKVQQGKVSIVSNEECRAMENIGQYVSNSTICISSDKVFTCQEDVGGPVVVMSSPGTWTVVGINSYTDEDCGSNGLKTRVSAFRSWIDQYM